MRELTLRQVEVIRAVLMTGTINGAAAFLNVSAPGISRLLKHTEASLGVRLFERKAGLFVPAAEAQAVFEQLHEVYEKVENLGHAVENLRKAHDVVLAFASVPSVAQFIAARAIRRVRRRFPDLYFDLKILTIENVVDYLLLERGEFVIMSYALDNPALECVPLAEGEIVAIVPDAHPLAGRKEVSLAEIAAEPLIGVQASDPYGRIVARAFVDAGIDVKLSIRGRFAQTVVSLVRHGLGVALIDEFSVAEVYMPGLTRLRLTEPTEITIYALQKRGSVLSSFAEFSIEQFRQKLQAAVKNRTWRRRGSGCCRFRTTITTTSRRGSTSTTSSRPGCGGSRSSTTRTSTAATSKSALGSSRSSFSSRWSAARAIAASARRTRQSVSLRRPACRAILACRGDEDDRTIR